ncbi:MAG: lipoate--protein ligase family protein [Prevotellaceae bacterium]|jgi:lipoate-protein ligase A|nr:lipoate--protein ligase family protein [Prevotellaceae bacterium]
MQIIRSPWSNPFRNCALEASLLKECSDNVLLLYINSPSVIVGRHQTVAAEVDEKFCAENNIPIVRRISGGGAVYHDEGNVNYAFIVNNTDGALELALDYAFIAPIVAALRALGLDAVVGDRKEIRCGGYKVSGTASHVSGSRQLFHGTLLYNTNLQQMERALKGNPALRGKGIPSIPDKVANIAPLLPVRESTEQFLLRIADFLQHSDFGKR